MERLKRLWHRITAPALLSSLEHAEADRDQWKRSFEIQVNLLGNANKALQDELRLAKSRLESCKAENEALRASDPMIRALDNVRHTAAQSRIRDLERENLSLLQRLRKHEGS